MLFAVALLLSMIPAAHAVGCRLQIIQVDYPSLVDPGESFPVKTQFNVTCSQSKAYIVGRFDVVESAPGVVLSSTSIPVGYFAGLSGGAMNATAVNDVVAPPLPANWTLRVRATLYTSTPAGVLGDEKADPFIIQVGHALPPEKVVTISILENGGFEKGLEGWEVEMEGGFRSVTSKVAHNSSFSLKLEMPQAPPPSGRIFGAMATGVSQTVSVEGLRSLRVKAWVMDDCYLPPYVTSCSLGGSGRLRVQVGTFTEKYEFADCGSWCLIDQNVTEDLRSRLTLAQFDSGFHSDHAVSVTISLELLNGGRYFVAYLDDVQVNATVRAPGLSASTASLSLPSAGLNMSNQGGAGTNVNAVTASCGEGVGVFQFQGYVRKTNSTFQRLGV